MQFQHLISAELTDVGRKRSNNEDAAIRLGECGVFAVADGCLPACMPASRPNKMPLARPCCAIPLAFSPAA